MFEEIEKYIQSILSDDRFNAIANMPRKNGNIEKVIEMIYDINFSKVERLYKFDIDSSKYIAIVYDTDKEDARIAFDSIINMGEFYTCILIPSYLLNKSEKNAKTLSTVIIKIVYAMVFNSSEKNNSNLVRVSSMSDTYYLAVPIISCAIIRKFYSGASLARMIHKVLVDTISDYAKFSVEGIESILDIFDEDISVYDLLDNSFICAFKDTEKYPGLWGQKIEPIGDDVHD